MITHLQTYTLSSNGSTGVVTGVQSEVGNSELIFSNIFPANTTAHDLAVNFHYSQLQSIALVSTMECTIEVNSGDPTAGALLINLHANSPFLWSLSNSYFPNPFGTVYVIGFYVTCVASGTLNGKILLNI